MRLTLVLYMCAHTAFDALVARVCMCTLCGYGNAAVWAEGNYFSTHTLAAHVDSRGGWRH